jgi:hypothetical protein
MDGVRAAPPAIDVFAALRLTLAGPVALEAAVHASWSFALSASSQHRMCFTLARQPSFVVEGAPTSSIVRPCTTDRDGSRTI